MMFFGTVSVEAVVANVLAEWALKRVSSDNKNAQDFIKYCIEIPLIVNVEVLGMPLA
ncbi:hypothetical protein swp_3843 [Shewanella piezotolerans WP3]|uniref:Uncharacterized protein n=1 Tax=Shewanella piezotolerans (strain WP3 / JCM 13877) TaxID=225849 RepID=B8CQQ5_SHEPW|nr:hypothetical protein swp_3843 [Shewanella piezotolerans WP3]